MKINNLPVRLLLIEDDELSREVLTLQIEGQGYQVETAESGDVALQQLQQPRPHFPDAVLTDLQMPGTSGPELSFRLRAISDPPMTLVAMSASQPQDYLLEGYDGFLLKPFTMKQLAAALQPDTHRPPKTAPTARPTPSSAAPSLDEAVYTRFAGSMTALQLKQLYALGLDDALGRLGRMRLAVANGDDPLYRREAHAIKGGCSMVGALELHKLAATAEEGGLPAANHVASLDEMLMACERLRRILVAREERATQ